LAATTRSAAAATCETPSTASTRSRGKGPAPGALSSFVFCVGFGVGGKSGSASDQRGAHNAGADP
jgi:hypothetical protein